MKEKYSMNWIMPESGIIRITKKGNTYMETKNEVKSRVSLIKNKWSVDGEKITEETARLLWLDSGKYCWNISGYLRMSEIDAQVPIQETPKKGK